LKAAHIWLSNSKVPLFDDGSTTDHIHSTGSDGSKNLRGFVIAGFIKWLITAVLLMGFVLAIYFYQGRVLSDNDKSIFDSIIVTLSLVVGLNIASALKDIARQMRWWFLSLTRRDLPEVRAFELPSMVVTHVLPEP
jgi:hypothetical protein